MRAECGLVGAGLAGLGGWGVSADGTGLLLG